MTNILEQALQGKTIDFTAKDYACIPKICEQNSRLMFALNNAYHENETILQILSEMTERAVDASNTILPPLYTDFGRHIFMGKNIFINRNVTFVDLGGIYLGDRVLLGPNVTLITVNHVEDPKQRRNLHPNSIHIESGAWLGANVTVLPGVTIGANAVVGAGSLVTKDVQPNTVVVGSPAQYMRKIHE